MQKAEKIAKALGLSGLNLESNVDKFIRDYQPSNPGAHPGISAMRHGFRTKGEAVNYAKYKAQKLVNHLRTTEGGPPSADLWGCVFDGTKPGVGRIVLMSEAWEPIVLGQLQRDLTRHFKTRKKAVGLWVNHFRGGTSELFDHLGYQTNRIDSGKMRYACTDFSGYASMPKMLIRCALDVIQYAYKPGKDRNEVKAVLKYAKRELMGGFVSLPSGEVVQYRGRNKTGSILTTIVNSIATFIAWRSYIKSMGWDYSDFRLLVYGDDSIVTDVTEEKEAFNIKTISQFMWSEFGLKVKPEASFITNRICTTEDGRGVEFLGYHIGPGLDPIRPYQKTAEQVWYPEREPGSVVQELENVLVAHMVNPFCSRSTAMPRTPQLHQPKQTKHVGQSYSWTVLGRPTKRAALNIP